jgi:Ciliary basal body-associated, B9 protein
VSQEKAVRASPKSSPQRQQHRARNAAAAAAAAARNKLSDDEHDSEDTASQYANSNADNGQRTRQHNSTLRPAVEEKLRDLGYMRRAPTATAAASSGSTVKLQPRNRAVAALVPEVHFIGELIGGTGFGSGVSCKFRAEAGKHWSLLAGAAVGQSHTVYADSDEVACWNHPIDLHYTTKSMQGWPRLLLQVWQLDAYGRLALQGYGFCHLPSVPGSSEVSVACWRPAGTAQEVSTWLHMLCVLVSSLLVALAVYAAVLQLSNSLPRALVTIYSSVRAWHTKLQTRTP